MWRANPSTYICKDDRKGKSPRSICALPYNAGIVTATPMRLVRSFERSGGWALDRSVERSGARPLSRSVERAGGCPLDPGAGRHAVVEPLDADLVHVGDEMLGDPLDDLLEFKADAQFHQARILEDGGGDTPLHAVAHLLLGLGRHAHLDESVVGVSDRLEEVAEGIGRDAVVLQAEGLKRGVLIHHGAEGRHREVVYLG
jgi:hypothetical protein